MLSILIPCYNYDVIELVRSISEQVKKTKKKYEIICVEDGSEKTFSNQEIKSLKNTLYIQLKKNIGRSKIRNFLAKKAKYNWLLYIDCDSKIVNKKFIQNYIRNIEHEHQIIYGTTKYQKNKPCDSKILHWKYGTKVESKRKKNIFSSHHFLIHKNTFEKIKFNEKIKGYGHEDTIFWIELNKMNYKFKHITNPLNHIGLESNKVYIEKTKNSIKNLFLLSEEYDLNKISLIRTYKTISFLFLNHLLLFLFKCFEKKIMNNLLSTKPNLFVFQFFKICYLCKIIKDY